MNKKANFLGMNNTIYSNPHGLDENSKNYSTAYDMALLSSYANKILLYKEITTTKYHDVKTNIKSYSWINRNKLVFNYPYFVSGKTGYTPSAGKTLVSTSKKDNLELTIVSLDDNNHYENHINIYNKMFSEYKNYLLISKDFFNTNYPNLYIKEDIYFPLANNEKELVDYKLVISNTDTSSIIVTLNDEEVLKKEVYKKDTNDLNTTNKSFWMWLKEIFNKIF